MDVDSDHADNVDDWLARFSPSGPFPFTNHKNQSIESRRARMSDLLIFDVLLIRGGIRTPDMLFPPSDWSALRKLLDAIDESVYDILKKDCLVYILLKWAWDLDPSEPNPAWDTRYLQDRCIAPQFAALADAYWLLDTGSHPAKAVSILSDARLNREHVSKILQALALSSSPASFASGNASATAALVVKYVRTAKPLLTEPDDIDLYALSLVQLSFMDAWAYQQSFPEGSDTRERLLGKIVGWCLMPTPKQEPLTHLVAFPLSPYEQSTLHALALPYLSSSLSNADTHPAATFSNPVLSPQAISILQDLLCVRAIQSGDYVGAIRLDRQFSSVSPSLGSGATPNITSQTTPSSRDTIDRKSIIQALFATLPPAERMLLEDEFGKVATGVRANPSTPRLVGPPARRSLAAGPNLSASWEDVGSSTGSPAPSASLPLSVAGKATPAPPSGKGNVNQSPFGSRVTQPQPTSGHQPPPVPKFTAFGSPIPPTPASTGRGVISERGKTLFSTSAVGSPSATTKPATRVSLFDTAGSAKNAPNAFFKPPSAPTASASVDAGSTSTAKNTGQSASVAKQNGKAQRGESDDEDVNMGFSSDAEDHRDMTGGEEQDAEIATDEDDNFITHDKGGAADMTLRRRDVDDVMGEDDEDVELEFSVFSGRSSTQNGNVSVHGRSVSGNGHAANISPPRTRALPTRQEDKRLNTSNNNPTPPGKRRAPPGAFHHEEEDEEDQHDQSENEDADEEDHRVSLTTPISSPRRSTRTRTQVKARSRSSGRSQPQHKPKGTTATTQARRTSSTRAGLAQSIPGALMDDDHDDHGRDETEHTHMHDDEDTEMDEQEEEDDAIAPLPSRSSRRTRSSGLFGTSTTTSTKSKSSTKPAAQAKATATASPAKGKAKARSSEVKTPARRSSRLSTASSLSPDYTEAASPAKKGRKSAGSRASIAGSGSGTVATRSSARRKR